MSFESRYKKLNTPQRTAVDHIDGPLMVVAGPGTGKTELLSMRTANILKQTDTLAQNILCLTFTESGADAMRRRLTDIIGADAYKVAIHTFHSFGSDIISRYSDYFYGGADFKPASELDVYEVLRELFDALDHTNPLAGTMNGEYVYLRDTIQSISELKKSGLVRGELIGILDDNDRILDKIESAISELFASRISLTVRDSLRTIATSITAIDTKQLPPGIESLKDVLQLSIMHAVEASERDNSTKPLTAWRNEWCEKNERGVFVFKDRKRTKKLRAISEIYEKYLLSMQERSLYDFDDMVLRVVHALEVFDELRFNLQEQYTYIMVDEFQDTNLAQSRLLANLTSNPANEGAPNIMVVGDDDQAIYSFQGAEVSNILHFKDLYEDTRLIVLKDNYRSSQEILSTSRSVITQGEDRLEHYVEELSKSLTARSSFDASHVSLEEFSSNINERSWIASDIAKKLSQGVEPSEITVIARRHYELVELLPFLAKEHIQVRYERRENILENEVVVQLELLSRVVSLTAEQRHQEANALLPKLFSHPAWKISAQDLWKISLTASSTKKLWLEVMSDNEQFAPLQEWIINQAAASLHTPLEPMLDTLTGKSKTDEGSFASPLYHYFFETKSGENLENYLMFLDGLRTLREMLRDHRTLVATTLRDFLDFLDLHRELKSTITSVRSAEGHNSSAINLMTAHKSKGLEFEHVYIYNSVDSMWGERVRSRSRLISYPRNLPIAPAGDSYSERMRLFFVAMTRAKHSLTMTYGNTGASGKPTNRASFLINMSAQSHEDTNSNTGALLVQSETAWYQPLIDISTTDTASLLTPYIERYRLSATHLNTFLDVSNGGPQHFLLHTLLRFPQSISPSAAYGSAVHKTLQRAHNYLSSTGARRPIDELLHDFAVLLDESPLSEKDRSLYKARGQDYLKKYFVEKYSDFSMEQTAELDFKHQQVQLGDAKLTGSLDVATINPDTKTIQITDYKTGSPSASWVGKSDYEKIKLHKYRQQLMFYTLLVAHSRDYAHLQPSELTLQFVEPTPGGDIVALSFNPSHDELAEFMQLIRAVWGNIQQLRFPETSQYSQNYKGMREFESDLLKNNA